MLSLSLEDSFSALEDFDPCFCLTRMRSRNRIVSDELYGNIFLLRGLRQWTSEVFLYISHAHRVYRIHIVWCDGCVILCLFSEVPGPITAPNWKLWLEGC